MDQDIRRAFQIARRCVARISFCRQKETKKDYKYMVIPGIIVSVDTENLATMVCDPAFFEEFDRFSVTFPTEKGYEEPQTVLSASVVKHGENFVTFSLKPLNADFVQSARIETRSPKTGDCVDALLFPRKSYVTAAAYCKGGLVYATDALDDVHVEFQESAFHEYGFLGSALFNRKGDLVGITYADIGCLIAWNVWQIKTDVLQYLNGISYVLDGALPEQAHV